MRNELLSKKKINEYKNLEIFRHKVAKVFSKNTQTHTEKKKQ